MKNGMYEIVQQTNYITEKQIEDGIKNGFKSILQYAYILHDKDTDKDGKPKAAHYHIYLRFRYSVDSKTVANWFNVEEQYINKIKGRFVDACLYANHSNAPDKYQYDINNIKANFDVAAFQKTKEQAMSKKQEMDYIEDIINRISVGEIRDFELNKYVSPILYTKYDTKLEKAFKLFDRNWRYERRANDIEVWFFTGGSGNGKTTIAKAIAENIIEQGKHKGICISSSSNDPLQDYHGEDFLILDDLRDNAFTYTDLVKLLDNNTRSSIKSRYNNKTFYGKYIFITSYLPLEDWYKNRKNKNDAVNEDKKQLYRRITKYFNILTDTVEEYNIINGDLNNKDFIRSYNNLIPKFLDLKEKQEKVYTDYDVQGAFSIIASKMGIDVPPECLEKLLVSICTDKEINKQIQQKREDDAKPF